MNDETTALNKFFVPMTWIQLIKSVSKSLSDFYCKKVGELLLDIFYARE